MLKVERMFAFVGTDASGHEGVLAAPGSRDGALILMPLIGADMARIDALRPMAQAIANGRGCDVTLAVFSVREDREVLTPVHGYKPQG